MALRVDENVGWLQIPMNHLSGVAVLDRLQQLVDDVLFVYF